MINEEFKVPGIPPIKNWFPSPFECLSMTICVTVSEGVDIPLVVGLVALVTKGTLKEIQNNIFSEQVSFL